MDGPGLSAWERRVLAEIEDELRVDARLDRRLSRMEHRWAGAVRLVAVVGRVPGAVLSVLLALSAGLLLVAASVHRPTVVALFAGVWAPTLVLVVARLLTRRRA